MYAPLALTFVHSKRLFIRCLTHYFLRAPVVQITANATTTTSSSSKATSHTGAIAGGIAGGVGALILVVGAIAFARRRRRKDRKSAGSSFSGAAMELGSQMTVTPFTPTLAGAVPLAAGSRSATTSEGPSSTSEPLLTPSQSVAPVPVGLTSKELAHLRSAAIRSPFTTHARSSSSGSHPTYPPTISTTEWSTTTPPPETRRLQTEMETLRREVQELRAERFEAPPSYGAGGGE